MILNNFFYSVKPIVPRKFQIFLRRRISNFKRNKYKLVWPIDPIANCPPENWKGWPNGKKFTLILNHDVDTQKGHNRVLDLLKIEKELGFKSSFNFVPERYSVSEDLINEIKSNGFGVGVHGLKHDGKLFQSRRIFDKRSPKINYYLNNWEASGFTAPSMICKLDWLHELNIGHSTCTFDTDPFEPIPNPSASIFPYTITNKRNGHSFIEIPYTLPQDHTLFIILQEKNNEIWKKKLDWISNSGGMAMLNTHPDYMQFSEASCINEDYPINFYRDFLIHIKDKYKNAFWNPLPSEVEEFWRKKQPTNKRDHVTTMEYLKPKRKQKRRVCVLAYTFYEHDFRVMRYSNALIESGDQVDVFALQAPGLKSNAVINGANVYRIQQRVINEKGQFSYLFRIIKFFIKSFLIISKKHLQSGYDLVHVHNVPDFLVFAALVPKLFGAKIILDIHDILPEFYASKFSKGKKGGIFNLMAFIEKISIGFSDHVIISNHIWKKRLETRSVLPHKCTAILNFVDQEIFKPRVRPKNNDNLILLYPGTVNWHQGLDIAVQAMHRIKDKVPNLFFHIYGSGTHLELLKNQIDELGLKNRIKIFDSKPLNEIAEIMANSDIGVIPKRNDQFGGEAFSTKTLEFMSCGIPIVVSRTRIDQYYFDNSLVKFFESESVDDLASSLLMLSNDLDLRNKLSENALHFVKGNSWNNKKKDYLDLVNRLCF